MPNISRTARYWARDRYARSSGSLRQNLMEAWSLDNGNLVGAITGDTMLASAGGTGAPVGVATGGPPFQPGFIRFATAGKILYTLAAHNPDPNVGWSVASWYRFITPPATYYLFGRWLATNLCFAVASEGVGGSESDFTTRGYFDDQQGLDQVRTNVANTTAGNWFHYLAVYDYSGSDKRITTYINGVANVSTSAFAQPWEQASSQQWTIAGINKAIAGNNNLECAQFCLWNKALTATEAATLFNAGQGRPIWTF